MDTVNTGLDELKAQQKKLSVRAVEIKMQLHDLSEELPLHWEHIPEVAARAFEIFGELAALRAKIAAAAKA